MSAYFLVTDFGANPELSNNDTAAIVDAYAAAEALRMAVYFPPHSAGAPGYQIGDTIVIPNGVETIVAGRVSPYPEADPSIFSMGSATIRFVGEGEFADTQLWLTGGSPKVFNFRYTGYDHTAAIYIQGEGSYAGVLIDGVDIRAANYGILRQGTNPEASQIDGGLILNGYFSELRGDAIEFNQVPGDNDILIANHVIENVDAGADPQLVSWGIGIGIAGLAYDIEWPEAQSAHGIKILNVRGKSLRQLIHLECANGIDIDHVVGEDIREIYSSESGLACGTVVCYGSKNVSLTSIRNRDSDDSAGIKFLGGTSGESYVNLCSNISLADIELDNGSVDLEVGRSEDAEEAELFSFLRATDVRLANGRYVRRGRSQHMLEESIHARSPRAAGAAFTIVTDIGDGRDDLRATVGFRHQVIDCAGVDEYHGTSASLDAAVATTNWIEGRGNNFAVPGNQCVNRTMYGNGGGGLPYGREYVPGDLVIDVSNGSRRLVTIGGSRTRADDWCAVLTSNIFRRTNGAYDWLDGDDHYLGQRITVTYLDTSTQQFTISRGPYLTTSGGVPYQVIEVAETIGKPVGTAGTISSTNTPTTVSV